VGLILQIWFLFCTFGDSPLNLVGLSANPKKRHRFRIQRYLYRVRVKMYECCNKVLKMAIVPQLHYTRTSTKMQIYKYKGQQRQIYIETLDNLNYNIYLF